MMEQELSKCIKDRIIKDFETNYRKGLYSLTQKMMAYNSNRIEGSTLTSEQTASLFDTGTIVSDGVEVYKAKDIEEMHGHFKMFNQMLKYIDAPLSISLIKSYHYQLKSGVFEDTLNGYPIGEFKNRANQVSDIKTARPDEVEQKLSALLDEFDQSDKQLNDIAAFHAAYENIHPFQDGNGRTGRIIIIKQCFDNGFVPVIINDNDKLLYYRALHRAQVNEDVSELVDFFKKSQKQYLQDIDNFVRDFEKDLIE